MYDGQRSTLVQQHQHLPEDAALCVRDLLPLVQQEDAPQGVTRAAEALVQDPLITFRATPMMGHALQYKPSKLGGPSTALPFNEIFPIHVIGVLSHRIS